jgi:hypothetical protein
MRENDERGESGIFWLFPRVMMAINVKSTVVLHAVVCERRKVRDFSFVAFSFYFVEKPFTKASTVDFSLSLCEETIFQ